MTYFQVVRTTNKEKDYIYLNMQLKLLWGSQGKLEPIPADIWGQWSPVCHEANTQTQTPIHSLTHTHTTATHTHTHTHTHTQSFALITHTILTHSCQMPTHIKVERRYLLLSAVYSVPVCLSVCIKSRINCIYTRIKTYIQTRLISHHIICSHKQWCYMLRVFIAGSNLFISYYYSQFLGVLQHEFAIHKTSAIY